MNNKLSNLEIVTPKENTKHAWKTGLAKRKLGELVSTSKFREKDIKLIRELYKSGMTQKQLAKKFSCHQTNIHYILSKKTWNHVKN